MQFFVSTWVTRRNVNTKFIEKVIIIDQLLGVSYS